MPTRLTETTPLSEAGTSTTKAGRMSIQVISPGWGSSGYYSPEVCETAAPLFTVGTQMFIDHPTAAEDQERPVRSVRDIAAVITEAGRWDPKRQAVVAECQVVGSYKEALTDLAEHIGLSIRGSATDVTIGEAEGRTGPIIEGLADIMSVDFVTRAGRGGKVLQVLESAAAERRAVAEATFNDTREALQTALRDTYATADNTWLYVRDFDGATVWFELEGSGAGDNAGVYGQPYTEDDGAVTLTGTRTEVRVLTTFVPVTRPGSPTTTESLKEDTMPQIEEARLRELEEASGRVPTLESELATEREARTTAEQERDQLRAQEAARGHARTRVTTANAQLASTTVDRIVAEATRTVPLTEAGQLDTAALDTAVDAARTAEETYLATLAEASGVGTVRGFGGSTATGDDEVTESELDNSVAGAFGRQVKEA